MIVRHLVGPIADLPDSEGVRVQLGERTVAVFRRGDRVFALGDSCPHMGASLSDGYLDATSVVCPWHGWAFDLQDGSSPFDAEALVEVYRVTVEEGIVYVLVDEEAADRAGLPCSEQGRD
jgi:nitrite reductase/ring-hydroxylating ferredoxin subunit